MMSSAISSYSYSETLQLLKIDSLVEHTVHVVSVEFENILSSTSVFYGAIKIKS